ncbi:hypothetical protein Nepgr_024797 [Nepenthes gracilis]|uniref:Uncharacterized protein n=1 Tax=Nepenthes gracilis TaxID=150966 RepID=A0AAD3T5S8_NEPGR|nr:hypothetical protein Nepgr_024797 [Nepenthes gracilis]
MSYLKPVLWLLVCEKASEAAASVVCAREMPLEILMHFVSALPHEFTDVGVFLLSGFVSLIHIVDLHYGEQLNSSVPNKEFRRYVEPGSGTAKGILEMMHLKHLKYFGEPKQICGKAGNFVRGTVGYDGWKSGSGIVGGAVGYEHGPRLRKLPVDRRTSLRD